MHARYEVTGPRKVAIDKPVRYLCQIHGVLSTLDTNPCSRAKFRLLVLDLENVSHLFDRDQSQLGGKDVVQSIQSLF